MAGNIGLLKVIFSADTAEFSTKVAGAKKELSSLQQIAQDIGPALDMLKVGAVAGAGGLALLINNTRNAAVEITRLSQIAGSSAQEFQRYSAGAAKAGMDMGKFADVLKDVQDKIGDYLATGGGELKEFFENIAPKVGVTAEAFRNLSGPQALQLFYNTLEKAGASQKELVFFLEAIGNDATALIPLLKENGRGFKEMGDQADRLGAVLDDRTIAASKRLDESLTRLSQMASGFGVTLAEELIPVIDEAAKGLVTFGDGEGIAKTAADALATVLETVVILGGNVAYVFRETGREIGAIAAQAAALASFDFDAVRVIGEERTRDANEARAAIDAWSQSIIDARNNLGTVLPVVTVTAGAIGNLGGSAKKTGADLAKFAEDSRRHFERMLDAEMAALQASRDLAGEGINAALAELQTTRDRIIAAKQEGESIGLSGRALADLVRQRYNNAAALKEEGAAALAALEPGAELVKIYQKEAEALRELGNIEYNNTVAQEFQQAAQSIEQSLTDALLRGFESGKDFAKNFRDTLKNMFMTMVLRPLIQPVMGAVAGTLAGLVPGVANAASGVGGIGNVLSLGSQLFSGTMGLGNVIGTAAANATGTGISGLLATNGAYGTAGGLMGGIGAALPYLGIGLAAIGLLGGAFKKPSNKSAWGDVNLATGGISGLDQLDGEKAPSQETLSARDMFLQVLGGFGQNVGAEGKLRIDIGSRDGIQAAWNGGALQGYGKDPDSALMGIMDEIIKSATIDPKVIAQWQVLKVSLDGTTKSASDMAEVMALLVNDVSMVDIERANIIKGENESIGQSYARLADMMGTAMDAGEMWRAAQSRLVEQFGELGLSVPKSSEAFGDLLQSIDITTESGRELFGALAEIGGQFLAVARAVEAAMAQISESTASSIRDIEMSVLDNEGKYAYLDKEIALGMEALKSAVDPAEVVKIAEQNRSLLMDAWSLVPEDSKASKSTEFIELLRQNEEIAAERLTTVGDDSAGPEKGDDRKDLEAALSAALESAASKIETGGSSVQSAADAIAAAVGSIPSRIVVENNVNVTVPEVGR